MRKLFEANYFTQQNHEPTMVQRQPNFEGEEISAFDLIKAIPGNQSKIILTGSETASLTSPKGAQDPPSKYLS